MDLITTPAVVGQSPPANSIVHNTSVSLTNRSPSEPVHLVQYDDTLPMVAVALTSNGQPYTVPSGAAVNVRLAKPDGTYVYNPAYGVSTDGQTVYIAITVQMTVCAGKVAPIIEVVLDGDVAGTGFFVLDIDPNPIPEDAIASTDEYQTIQQLAAEVTVAANVITQNIDAINTVSQNIDAVLQAPQQAANAAASATLAQSWAVGGTGSREGENTNNAEYFAQQAQQVSQGAVGWYPTSAALQAAHPTGENGNWAIVGDTDTIWSWDSDTNQWVNSNQQPDMTQYYTKTQADELFATAAQGQLAQSAVQSVNGKNGSAVSLGPEDIGADPLTTIAGVGGVRNFEGQTFDVREIDPSNPGSVLNTPAFFGSNNPATDIPSTPVTSRPFYGYRVVLFGKLSNGSPHFITVRIIETHPDYAGNIWSATYNAVSSSWGSWKNIQGV